MAITRATLPQIRNDIDAALAAVEAKHNIKFNTGRITFEPGVNFRCKLEAVSTADSTGKAVNPDKKNFESKAFLVGVKKTSFGKSFRVRGVNYTITGLNTRAKKYPIKAVRGNGQQYKFPVDMLPKNLRS
jgi:hypothetical protein